jgi:hypothetical protein
VSRLQGEALQAWRPPPQAAPPPPHRLQVPQWLALLLALLGLPVLVLPV